MKNIVLYLDVNQPIGITPPGGMVVIGGDAPAWKFCNLCHKCIMEGAAVVATGPGTDKSTSGDDYITAYSTDMMYQIGKPTGQNLIKPGEERDDLGDIPVLTLDKLRELVVTDSY